MKHWITVLLLFVLVSLIFLYDSHIDYSKVILGGGDTLMFLWNLFWVSDAVTHGKDLFFSDLIYYPSGVNVSFSNITYVEGLIYYLVKNTVGLVSFYNLALFVKFVLSGFFMYLFLNHFIQNRYICFLGGMMYELHPYHQYHAFCHLNVITIEWLPLFLLFYFRGFSEKKYWMSVLAGFFFFLSAIECWYYMIYLVFFIVLHFVWVVWNKELTKHHIILWTIVCAVAGTGILPFAWPMLTDKSGINYYEYGGIYSLDLLSFITPTSLGFFRDFFKPVNDVVMKYSPADRIGYLGISFLVLYFILMKKVKLKNIRFYQYIMVIFIILSLGQFLRIYGYHGIGTDGTLSRYLPFLKKLPVEFIGIPLPFLIFEKIPFFDGARVPARNLIFFILFFILTFGMYAEAYLKRFSRHKQLIAYAAVFLLIFIEFYIPYKDYTEPGNRKIYHTLAALPGDVVVNIPMLYDIPYTMFAQVYHKKKITMGIVPRPPAKCFEYYRSHPFFSRYFFPTPSDIASADISRVFDVNENSLQLLKKEKYRYILYYEAEMMHIFKEHMSDNDAVKYNEKMRAFFASKFKLIGQEDGIYLYDIGV